MDTHPLPPSVTRDDAIVCLSHLRWSYAFHRPQHLMSRFATERRVYFIEDPIEHDGPLTLQVQTDDSGVRVVVPLVPRGRSAQQLVALQRRALDYLLAQERVDRYALWYYNPMALAFTQHLSPCAVIYDCMDALTDFAETSPELVAMESSLLERADVVFTTRRRDAPRRDRPSMECILAPTMHSRSVDVNDEPEDQHAIAHPRLGFVGVLDARFDVALVAALAARRPDWQFVFIGPVCGIDPNSLPRAANLHYLGPRGHDELPSYLAGWDVALLPLADRDARHPGAPVAPELLAAGRPVVSTAHRDGALADAQEVFEAASTPEAVEAAVERCLRAGPQAASRVAVHAFLKTLSWDRTFRDMRAMLDRHTASAPPCAA